MIDCLAVIGALSLLVSAVAGVITFLAWVMADDEDDYNGEVRRLEVNAGGRELLILALLSIAAVAVIGAVLAAMSPA